MLVAEHCCAHAGMVSCPPRRCAHYVMPDRPVHAVFVSLCTTESLHLNHVWRPVSRRVTCPHRLLHFQQFYSPEELASAKLQGMAGYSSAVPRTPPSRGGSQRGMNISMVRLRFKSTFIVAVTAGCDCCKFTLDIVIL